MTLQNLINSLIGRFSSSTRCWFVVAVAAGVVIVPVDIGFIVDDALLLLQKLFNSVTACAAGVADTVSSRVVATVSVTAATAPAAATLLILRTASATATATATATTATATATATATTTATSTAYCSCYCSCYR